MNLNKGGRLDMRCLYRKKKIKVNCLKPYCSSHYSEFQNPRQNDARCLYLFCIIVLTD